MAALTSYEWPGNIRELQNAIERAFALSAQPSIDVADLPPAVFGGKPRHHEERTARPLLTSLDDAERRSIEAAIAAAQGNKNEAARILGIDRQRLYRKLRKHGLGNIQ